MTIEVFDRPAFDGGTAHHPIINIILSPFALNPLRREQQTVLWPNVVPDVNTEHP